MESLVLIEKMRLRMNNQTHILVKDTGCKFITMEAVVHTNILDKVYFERIIIHSRIYPDILQYISEQKPIYRIV